MFIKDPAPLKALTGQVASAVSTPAEIARVRSRRLELLAPLANTQYVRCTHRARNVIARALGGRVTRQIGLSLRVRMGGPFRGFQKLGLNGCDRLHPVHEAPDE